MSDDNLPDDLRIPLNELQADAKYLIGRVMQDAESGPMIATAILEKLSQIESASYRAIFGSNPPADDLLRQAIDALRELTEACVEDFGDGEDYGDGDEPVGGGRKEDGTPDPMAVTFGHIRKARGVLTAYDKRGK